MESSDHEVGVEATEAELRPYSRGRQLKKPEDQESETETGEEAQHAETVL